MVPKELKDKAFLKANSATEEFVEELRLLQSTVPSRSLLEQSLAQPLKQVFVIMKFGDPSLDSAYEGVIKPLGLLLGYKVLRVDEIQDSGVISQQILESISRSELVLADLSGERPNCYYEAGFAHALGREIIFSRRKGEKVHFDLAGHRFIEWETEEELRRKLRQRLESHQAKGGE